MLKRFGPVPWGNNMLPLIGAPSKAACFHCAEEIGPLDEGYSMPGSVFFHRECLVHALLGPPALEGDNIRATAKAYAKAVTVGSGSQGVVSDSGRKYFARDRLRLERAKAVLVDPNATKEDVNMAVLSLSATDDPHPEFLRTYDALLKRSKEMDP